MNYLDNLTEIAAILREGGVILCPTDTIWGLSCDATQAAAVKRIFDIKQRDLNKPLIVLMSDLAEVKKYVSDLHPRIENLMAYHMQPLTIIHTAGPLMPRHLVGENGSIAIRLTSHPLLINLMQILGTPLVSTSANLQGSTTPKLYHEIGEDIKQQVDYTCRTDREPNGQVSSASQIIRYTQEGELIFIRE